MKRIALLIATSAVAVTLTACGGDSDTDSYCDAVKDAKDKIDVTDFEELDQDAFDDLQSTIGDIEDDAPDDIKSEWSKLGGALDEFEKILSDAGLSFDDLEGLQSGDVPDGVDVQALQEVAKKLQEFTSNTDLEDASNAIEKNVKDECDVTLEG